MTTPTPLVAICMGSTSDLPTMRKACEILRSFDVPFETRILSAHRTPEAMVEFGQQAVSRGLKVIIAGAGGAAHLPGMLASLTPLPVIGVPVLNGALSGLDALLSIVQMPRGVPVATVAIDNATNAGYLALRMLGMHDETLRGKLETHRQERYEKVRADDAATLADES